jgi:ribosomal protein S21
MKVINTKDNLEATLRKFKKKILDSGKLQDLREREFYDKPSKVKKLAKGRAQSRWKKHLDSQSLPKKLY